ncbi:MAG: hypothetical protein MJ210_01220 [Alphaproteobacteria bacterium]|nr:hypothetical protein [Alphaproteobacteria bacterium]
MIKALFASIGIGILFFLIYWLGIYDFLASRTFFWVAVILFVTMLIVAGVVLGVPYTKDSGNDKD